MTKLVGIPRGLMYYDYAVLWETFFKTLGYDVIVSGPTNKEVVDLGSRRVSDEACLPVKVYMGHVAQMCEKKLDFLFIPRLVSIEERAYTCPKIIGLPDMVEASKLNLPFLLKPIFNMAQGNKMTAFFRETALALGLETSMVRKAWQKASHAKNLWDLKMTYDLEYDSMSPGEDLTILLLGHNYIVEDAYLNLNLLDKLQNMGCRLVFPQDFSKRSREEVLKILPKRLFWTYGRILLGAAFLFTRLPVLKGAIILTSFGCGIDSIIGNMIMRHFIKEGVPFLNLTLDEHTGEAGVVTRVEAFLDMIRWRRAALSENHFSPYGTYLADFERTSGISGSCCYSSSTIQ